MTIFELNTITRNGITGIHITDTEEKILECTDIQAMTDYMERYYAKVDCRDQKRVQHGKAMRHMMS